MSDIKLINLCPHDIAILDSKGTLKTLIPKSGKVARCDSKTMNQGYIIAPNAYKIPLTLTEYTSVQGVPDPEKDTIFIVSSLVAEAFKNSGRTDIRIINGTTRKPGGEIIGGRSLGIIPPTPLVERIKEYCNTNIRQLNFILDASGNHREMYTNLILPQHAIYNAILKLIQDDNPKNITL